MKILILTPTQRECDNMKAAISKLSVLGRPMRNTYKVVVCGMGKVNAAMVTAEELSTLQYDLVVNAGYISASAVYRQGDIVMPNSARYADCSVPEGYCDDLLRVYELCGPDSCQVLTADMFVDAPVASTLMGIYGNRVVFDMESAAIAQVATEYNLPMLVVKMVSDVPQANDNAQSVSEFVLTHTDFSAFANYLEAVC